MDGGNNFPSIPRPFNSTEFRDTDSITESDGKISLETRQQPETGNIMGSDCQILKIYH